MWYAQGNMNAELCCNPILYAARIQHVHACSCIWYSKLRLACCAGLVLFGVVGIKKLGKYKENNYRCTVPTKTGMGGSRTG